MGGELNPGSLPGLSWVAFWDVNRRVEPVPANCNRWTEKATFMKLKFNDSAAVQRQGDEGAWS
jgi:hypothetical protein